MKRLAPILSLLLVITSAIAWPAASPAAAAAVDGCTGESRVTFFAGGGVGIQATEGGQPAAGALVVVRDSVSGVTLGGDWTNPNGELRGTLREDIAQAGIALEIAILLPSGQREVCNLTVPPSGEVTGLSEVVSEPAGEPQPLEVVFETLFASGFGPAFRNIYETINIPVVYRELPPEVFGAYNGRRIALNWYYASNPAGLSVVLAHELTHALQDYEGRLVHPPAADSNNCFDAEFEATFNDARVWLSFYPQLRTPVRDALDADLNRTARVLLREGREGIRRMVRANYVEQCARDQYGRQDDVSFEADPSIEWTHAVSSALPAR